MNRRAVKQWLLNYGIPAFNLYKAQKENNMTGYKSKRAAAQDKLAQPEQEPAAWPCVIAEANFEQNTITLEMQCSNYKVGAGQHWLYTTPPQRPWVDLTEDQIKVIEEMALTKQWAIRMALAQLKECNA